ncbi:hypothetical protein UACE39S_05016 [Ureibacillus acetophenoni]
MDKELKRLYEPYDIPKEILKLIDLDRQLEEESLSLQQIFLRPILEPFAYAITPVDCIPFADTGGDGIHFAFLTEFGEVNRLEDAPIICVSPTNDPPIRMVAKNIRDFFNLVASVPFAELLESAWGYKDEAQLKAEINEIVKDTPSDLIELRNTVLNRLKQTFNANEVEVTKYIKQTIKEREKHISIKTLDGLGITSYSIPIESNNSLDFQYPLTQQEIERMKGFLVKANKIEKLAFIRDANYSYVVAPGFDEEVLELILELLLDLDLINEKERLNWRI